MKSHLPQGVSPLTPPKIRARCTRCTTCRTSGRAPATNLTYREHANSDGNSLQTPDFRGLTFRPNYTVKVKVGSVEHPMTDAHHIEWIAIETENGNQRKELKPGDKPEATFALVPRDKVKSVYEYCNLHGLWKT